jgi:hypothetical protein
MAAFAWMVAASGGSSPRVITRQWSELNAAVARLVGQAVDSKIVMEIA